LTKDPFFVGTVTLPGLDRGEGATWLRGDGAGVGQPLMSGQRWQHGGGYGDPGEH